MGIYKTASVTRTSGDVYSVTYPGRAGCDRDVPWSYIRGLLRRGYTVHLDQSGYCPEGEPRLQTYSPSDA